VLLTNVVQSSTYVRYYELLCTEVGKVLYLCDVCMVYVRYMGIISLTLTYNAIATPTIFWNEAATIIVITIII